MRAKVNDLVSVIWSFEARSRRIRIHKIHWQNRDYVPAKIDFHHKSYHGRTLVHYFSVADEQAGLYFKLCFDTKGLTWMLEEVADNVGS